MHRSNRPEKSTKYSVFTSSSWRQTRRMMKIPSWQFFLTSYYRQFEDRLEESKNDERRIQHDYLYLDRAKIKKKIR